MVGKVIKLKVLLNLKRPLKKLISFFKEVPSKPPFLNYKKKKKIKSIKNQKKQFLGF